MMLTNNYDAWFLLLAFLQLINIMFDIIIIGVLIYNIIKRAERFKPIEQKEQKDGIGFGR